jgi:hypothetical protein
MRFETKKDLKRETKAILRFCDHYGLIYKKLSEWDIDFALYRDDNLVGYAEVKGRLRNSNESYPLPLAIRKVFKLSDRKNPVIIWACDDGILYAKLENLIGVIKKGGRIPREGSVNDIELMAYYDKQEQIKFLKYD